MKWFCELCRYVNGASNSSRCGRCGASPWPANHANGSE